MKKLILTLTVLIFTISVYAESAFKDHNKSDLPRKAKRIEYFKSGNIKELVKNSWTDRLKAPDGGRVYYSYEQGYNYEKKQGFLKIYDENGKIIEEKWDKEIDGAICQEEALVAFEVFKKNNAVIKQFNTTNETIELQTGFNYIDEDQCKPGNRCVHVFARAGDISVLAHSIIKLNDLSVPYPEFDMETTYKKQKLGLYKSTKIISKRENKI